MEDHYVVLLEKVVVENVRLREAIEVRDNEQRRMFEELSSKLESSLHVRVNLPRKDRDDRAGKEQGKSKSHSNMPRK